MCGVRVAAASPRPGVPWSSREVGAWGLGAEQGECAGESQGPGVRCVQSVSAGPLDRVQVRSVGAGRARAEMCESARLSLLGPGE